MKAAYPMPSPSALSSALPPERAALRAAFLHTALEGGEYTVQDLPADASFRTYARLYDAQGAKIVMNAPGSELTGLRDFIRVAGALHEQGLRAPRIFAEDTENGFLLLEDFGDDSFSRILAAAPEREASIYLSAVSALTALRGKADEARFAPYDNSALSRETDLVTEWYLPYMADEGVSFNVTETAEAYRAFWETANVSLASRRADIVLRDFHADNLHVLRDGVHARAVGVLDFQDALAGDGIYDLVSLLTDIRRRVSPETARMCYDAYYAVCGAEAGSRRAFDERCALFAAQRNCKILGIFVRLARRDGKHRYLNYLPAVREAVREACGHSALSVLREILSPVLQEPEGA